MFRDPFADWEDCRGHALHLPSRLKRGPVQITAFDQDSRVVSGTGQLVLIDNAIYHATATMRLKAVFANTGEVLWPGESRLQSQSLAPCAAAEKRLYPPFGIGRNAFILEHVVRMRFVQWQGVGFDEDALAYLVRIP